MALLRGHRRQRRSHLRCDPARSRAQHCACRAARRALSNRSVDGGTRLAGVIGWPVRHSLSPVMHNAAYAAMGVDIAYAAFPVPESQVARAVDAVRALGLVGLSVTAPHKAAVIEHLDRVTEDAAVLDAVNCISNDNGMLVGHNTDGAGFVESLRDRGYDPKGRRCFVVGAGGAARAVALALVRSEAYVQVWNRSAGKAQNVADMTEGAVTPAEASEVARAEIVINATTVGMAGTDAQDQTPVDVGLLHASQVVADLVYHPRQTPLLAAAQQRGAMTVEGTGMLLHQAAMQIKLWTGRPAPVDVMRRAAGL